MTTPLTPAGWYPDIEVPGGLRYWDGVSWTEHRTPPAVPPPPAAEPTPSVEPPAASPTWEMPMPSWDAPSTTPAYQQPATPSATPAYGLPSYQTPQYAPPPPGSPPGDQFPPPGSGGGNNKVALAILGVVVAAALIATLALVYFFVVKRDDKSTTTASSSTSQTMTKPTSTKTSKSQSPETAPTSPQASGSEITDGDLSIAFSRTDTGDTITSSISDSLQATAKGEYFVVYFNVTNNGSTSDSLLLAQQKLKSGDQTFDADPEANFYLTGTATVDIAPGSTEEVGVVFDVPVGTQPDSMEVFGGVTSSGVNLPLS